MLAKFADVDAKVSNLLRKCFLLMKQSFSSFVFF